MEVGVEDHLWPSTAGTGRSVPHGVTELTQSRTPVDSRAAASVLSRTADEDSTGADMAEVQSEASACSCYMHLQASMPGVQE